MNKGLNAHFSFKVSKMQLGIVAIIFLPVLAMQFFSLLSVDFYSLFVLFYIFFIFLLALFFPSPIGCRARFFSFFFLLFLGSLTQLSLPVLAGPDENIYFDRVVRYDFHELVEMIFNEIKFDILIVSARISFPAIVSAYFGDPGEAGAPYSILFVNTLVWGVASLVWVNLVFESRRATFFTRRSCSVLFFMMLCLPSSFYWSSMFAKDIMSTSLVVFSVASLARKNLFFFFVWLFLATLLRPYSIAIALAFYVFIFNVSFRKIIAILIGIFVFLLFLAKGNFAIIFNSFIIFFYSFISPNPFDLSNWVLLKDTGTWVLSPFLLSLEACVLSILLVVGICRLIRGMKAEKNNYFNLGVSILIGSCVLALVGYENYSKIGQPYVIGTLGDNMLRKKLAYWPLIVTWASTSLVFISNKCFSKKHSLAGSS